MAKGQEIICEGFVPDGKGGYRRLEELSPEEKAAFSKSVTERMGRVFEEYFSRHPEVYARL